VASDNIHDGAAQLFAEASALFGAFEAELGTERESGEPLILRLSFACRAAKLRLAEREQAEEIGSAESVLRAFARQAEAAEKFGRKNVALSGSAITALDHVAAAALPRAFEEMGASEFADMIVDALAGKAQAASEAGGGIGLAERVEDAQAKGVEKRGGARDVRNEIPSGRGCRQWGSGLHRGISAKKLLSVKKNIIVNTMRRETHRP
jgi:hypothetical protein